MRLRYNILFLLSLGFLVLACDGFDSRNRPDLYSLQGAYETCVAAGPSSEKVVMVFYANNLFSQEVYSYASSGCTGVGTKDIEFTGTYSQEILGGSEFEPGATNISITPDVDVYGCGAFIPAYSYFRIHANYQGFDESLTGPSCDPDNRGSGYGATFLRVY